jgi:hypothetical protein
VDLLPRWCTLGPSEEDLEGLVTVGTGVDVPVVAGKVSMVEEQDLQKEALVDLALAQGRRSKAQYNLENKIKKKGMHSEILGLIPDSHMASVILDSGVVFSPSAGTPAEALSLLRAKEQV